MKDLILEGAQMLEPSRKKYNELLKDFNGIV